MAINSVLFGLLSCQRYPYVYACPSGLQLLTFLGQAIYPTVIIIFVQKLMSQENVVFSEAPYHNKGYPPANGRSDHLERGDGNRALSAIRFDRSRPETVSENEGHNDHTEKERELAIV